ncbi:hypothetical protein [Gloeobacter kilaueensis]|nr:hypothetical protein [Gloeobacter kilaueensis]
MASTAQAITYTEQGDAGDIYNVTGTTGAQLTTGSGELTSISGIIDPNAVSQNAPTYGNDVDMYGIFLTAGTSFSATTSVNTPDSSVETELYLFNSSGVGQVWNDNTGTDPTNADTLASISNFSVQESGIYYLAIGSPATLGNYVPLDTAGNPIFLSAIDSGPNFGFQIIGNSPAVSDTPFGSWGADEAFTSPPPQPSIAFSNYTISLQGAQAAPEPAVGSGLLAIGALGFFAGRKRKLRAKQAG